MIRASIRTGLAALLASTALGAGALAAGAAEPAEEEPFSGTYSAAASADGLRVTMTLPAAPLSNTVADVGGPTAQAVLNSNGESQAFASFPYPGANLAVAGGLVKGASNGQVPAPDYPFYVVAYNPTVHESQVGSGPYAIRAQSYETSSEGTASAGVKTPGIGTLGLAEAKASTRSSLTAVVGSASSHVTGLAIGPLEIGKLVSSATATLGTDGQLERKAETRVVAAKVGLTPVLIDANGVSVAGTAVPPADTAGVREVLAGAGITVETFVQENPESGVVAPVIRIKQTEAQSGATLTYTLGGTTAFVTGIPAEAPSSVADEAVGDSTPASTADAPSTPPSDAASAGSTDAAVPVPPDFASAAQSAGDTLTNSAAAFSPLPASAGTLAVPDFSAASSFTDPGSIAAPGVGADSSAAVTSGDTFASPAGTVDSSRMTLAGQYVVTTSNAAPMLIALGALIALALGAALGVHLLSKEART